MGVVEAAGSQFEQLEADFGGCSGRYSPYIEPVEAAEGEVGDNTTVHPPMGRAEVVFEVVEVVEVVEVEVVEVVEVEVEVGGVFEAVAEAVFGVAARGEGKVMAAVEAVIEAVAEAVEALY